MSLNYIPAVCKESSYRWYILYHQWHPIKNKRIRFRETYDLNRIKDIDVRRAKAKVVINEINMKLAIGWPFEDLIRESREITITEAMLIAAKIKMTSKSIATRNSYSSMIYIFLEFMKSRNWEEIPLKKFTKRHALAFLDHSIQERKIGNTTYNNYISTTKAIFSSLVERDYIYENPFSKLRTKKPGGKKRRAFTDAERSIVIKHIRAKDSFLFLGVLLQYHCFIRPGELCFLRRHMIDFKNGIIRIPGEISKNNDNEIVTIPDSALDAIKAIVCRIPSNYFIFGSRLKPNADKPCSKNYMNMKHRDVLHELKESGVLTSIKGLSYYSWKDTGAITLFKNKIDANEIMRQMRHKDLSYTQLYCKSLYSINPQIKEFDNKIDVS